MHARYAKREGFESSIESRGRMNFREREMEARLVKGRFPLVRSTPRKVISIFRDFTASNRARELHRRVTPCALTETFVGAIISLAGTESFTLLS